MPWIKPNLYEETLDCVKASQKLQISFDKIISAFNKGVLIQLQGDWYNHISNCDACDIESIEDAINICKLYGQEFERVLDGLRTNVYMAAPILLKCKRDYYCIAGNVRLMFCKALGIKPTVYVITLPANDSSYTHTHA